MLQFSRSQPISRTFAPCLKSSCANCFVNVKPPGWHSLFRNTLKIDVCVSFHGILLLFSIIHIFTHQKSCVKAFPSAIQQRKCSSLYFSSTYAHLKLYSGLILCFTIPFIFGFITYDLAV